MFLHALLHLYFLVTDVLILDMEINIKDNNLKTSWERKVDKYMYCLSLLC